MGRRSFRDLGFEARRLTFGRARTLWERETAPLKVPRKLDMLQGPGQKQGFKIRLGLTHLLILERLSRGRRQLESILGT